MSDCDCTLTKYIRSDQYKGCHLTLKFDEKIKDMIYEVILNDLQSRGAIYQVMRDLLESENLT